MTLDDMPAEAHRARKGRTRDPFRVRSRPAMGTLFTVYLHHLDEARELEIFQAVFDEIARIEKTFSRFLPSSEIARINREAGQGPVVTDPEVFHLLEYAKNLSGKTEGAFDITIGRLTHAWGFAERKRTIPSSDALEAAEAAVGWKHLQLDAQWRTVEFLKPGMELDLGAIAKGYAVDCALDLLRSLAVQALIDAGSSSIAANGDFFSRAWPVCVADPASGDKLLCEVLLGDRALSTSGVKEQSFTWEGRVYSHLLDPASHQRKQDSHPLQVLQTTVLAPDSRLADGLSTALFLLGPRRGKAVMEQFPECSAFWSCRGDKDDFCTSIRWPQMESSTE
jgi:thiamine biosynthesis lipoprotein